MHSNSLGAKYLTLMADTMVRPEGVLVWLRRRCELRVTLCEGDPEQIQKDTLTDMLRMCLVGMNESQTQTMRGNLTAMCDLNDDEGSPRMNLSETEFQLQVQQSYQAYQIGRNIHDQVRRDNAESMEISSETGGEEIEGERCYRYVNSSLSDVSQPDLRMEIHNEETIEERYRRYFVSERDEVSDVEYWDDQFARIMGENAEIERGEFPEFPEFPEE